MAAFTKEKSFSTTIDDISRVGTLTEQYFISKGYVTNIICNEDGFFLSIHKDSIFKTILGTKTALNIDVKLIDDVISVSASVGIFGMQFIPSLISYFIAWPVLLTQIYGLVSQAKLDDEAVNKIEEFTKTCESEITKSTYCTNCGGKINQENNFCPICGAKLTF